MTRILRLCALSLPLLFPLAAQSGSLLASSHALSRAISTTIRASSQSLRDSSRASERAVALNEGDYRVVEIADISPDAGLGLTLMPVASVDPADAVDLVLPAGQRVDLTRGAIVSVRSRSYGVAVFRQGEHEAFALVLADSRAIDPTPVSL